jgi:hypothetical protein
MRKFAGLLVALFITPVAEASMPHVELSVHYRPVSGAPNNVRLKATNFGPGNAYVMSYQTAFALPEGRTTGKWLQVRDQGSLEARPSSFRLGPSRAYPGQRRAPSYSAVPSRPRPRSRRSSVLRPHPTKL